MDRGCLRVSRESSSHLPEQCRFIASPVSHQRWVGYFPEVNRSGPRGIPIGLPAFPTPWNETTSDDHPSYDIARGDWRRPIFTSLPHRCNLRASTPCIAVWHSGDSTGEEPVTIPVTFRLAHSRALLNCHLHHHQRRWLVLVWQWNPTVLWPKKDRLRRGREEAHHYETQWVLFAFSFRSF